ncbi:Lactate utilization protein B/C [Desulfovibrio sp. X2]|uniref:lactate utilization protein n=1 Tax=Desulfovibrio sp. X2 TaxID=941449 RepID=UPI000358CE20|nr:lactate utilization protein [Desulfovibrio sp. X2]EPR40240.1 Lactate utilization protein B/C [Desulfovibrio sp. X2]
MDSVLDRFWIKRLEDVKVALEENNFVARVAATADEAREIVVSEVLPATGAESVTFGGSMSVSATGLYEALKARPGLAVIDTYDRTISREEMYERRRQALLADLFVSGTNAVTMDGLLVNLDMIGNRSGGINFGPRHVVVLAGRNKVCDDLESAMARIKSVAAPANALRLNMKTPCVKTGVCIDCKSPDRICNTWAITEKCFPKHRITVVLVNQDLGL